MSFEKALGIHPEALNFRVERSQVLASNVANAETPNYAARDIEFAKAYKKAADSNRPQLMQPIKPMHTELGGVKDVQYRIPHQPSKDGNTVELGMEQARLAQNNMDFQTSLTFLKSKFSGLNKAVDGQ